jgi:preprotein translocase subunit YajC
MVLISILSKLMLTRCVYLLFLKLVLVMMMMMMMMMRRRRDEDDVIARRNKMKLLTICLSS